MKRFLTRLSHPWIIQRASWRHGNRAGKQGYVCAPSPAPLTELLASSSFWPCHFHTHSNTFNAVWQENGSWEQRWWFVSLHTLAILVASPTLATRWRYLSSKHTFTLYLNVARGIKSLSGSYKSNLIIFSSAQRKRSLLTTALWRTRKDLERGHSSRWTFDHYVRRFNKCCECHLVEWIDCSVKFGCLRFEDLHCGVSFLHFLWSRQWVKSFGSAYPWGLTLLTRLLSSSDNIW